jgi:hypothetical protein
MEIREVREVETVVDFICDVCRQSCCKHDRDIHSAEYGTLRANWGYWSRSDQTTEECHLCEDCFTKVRDFIASLGGAVRRQEF